MTLPNFCMFLRRINYLWNQKNEIDKIISIKNTFEIRIPFKIIFPIINDSNPHEICRIATAHIVVFHPLEDDDTYLINVYNCDRYKKKPYSPHGLYTYIIRANNNIALRYSGGTIITDILDRYRVVTPYGWSDDMINTLQELLNILSKY